jgi:hypothetical protein
MLGWHQYGFDNKCAKKCYTELVFLHLMVSVGHITHFRASRVQNIEALFFMLRWDWYRFYKKSTRTRYAELVFLHPVGYAGHVVHSGVFGP